VLISRESLERSITFRPPETIANPAKIITKDNFILILERFKGVHVIDNSNIQNPVKKGYIAIPGCSDITIKDNILYADNAVDLVAIDLSNITSNNVAVVKRIENNFDEISPPDGHVLPEKYEVKNRPANTVLIAWEK